MQSTIQEAVNNILLKNKINNNKQKKKFKPTDRRH